MAASAGISRAQAFLLWGLVLLYALAHLCHLYADRLPWLLIIVLHVVPPALFAVVHGSMLYRAKGMAIFSAFCLGLGALAEKVSLRTGFPFGNYVFTDLMGPKIFEIPFLLALAYLGLGYVSWVLALLILGYRNKPITGVRAAALPLLASFIMLAWDLSMDPSWSTLGHAWIWQQGGAYFGVPLSNFFGWFLTAYLYYQAFALYCRAEPAVSGPSSRGYWGAAICLYGVCAVGNTLLLKQPMVPRIVTDASGKQWLTADLLGSCVLVSLLVMAPLALLAWLRLQKQRD